MDRRPRRRQAYGVDLIVPAKFEGKGENLSRGELAGRIPEDYRGFIAELLAAHDIEPEESPRTGPSFLSGDTGQDLLEVAMSHPIKLIANALGVPPDYMIDAGKERGVPVAALVGAKEHAVKQVAAGVDLIVAQGTEAGGHCGEVTTMVLIPEVIEAIERRRCRCWPPAGSSPAGRWPRPSRWAPTARGRDRCG